MMSKVIECYRMRLNVIEGCSSTFDLFGGPLVEVGQVVGGGLKCKDGRGLDVLQIDFAAETKKTTIIG
jgi:hypothetical protein